MNTDNLPRCLHFLGLYLPYSTGLHGLPVRLMTDTTDLRPVHAQSGEASDFNSQTVWAANEALVEATAELINLFGD